MTVRTPSRIRPLLNELLEVLVSIIQPPQPPSTRPPELLFPPPPQHPQFQQNVAHVALLRQLLDPDLIQQEIGHGLFDPSGVFQAIGDIIRCHCAPMRDAAVDQMVALARSCAPGGSGTKLDAVRAIRMCFEIMELMKLVSAAIWRACSRACLICVCFSLRFCFRACGCSVFARHRMLFLAAGIA